MNHMKHRILSERQMIRNLHSNKKGEHAIDTIHLSDANEFSKIKTDMEGKVVTYKVKLGEKVINKVNVLTMMKLFHQLLWLNPFRFS